MKKRLLLLMTATFATAGLAAPAARAEPLALVIGVNECPGFVLADGTRPRPLQGAEADASELAERLHEQFGFRQERIRLLLGASARRADVQKAFAELAAEAKPDDVFVFYFAGHGMQLADVRPLDEEDRRDEALCLADATADAKGTLRDDELGRWLEDLPAARVTAVLDCCHSGTGIKDPDDESAARYLPAPEELLAPAKDASPWVDLTPATKSADKQIVALFACQPHQRAYERRLAAGHASRRRGQFTAHLLDGLSRKQADADGDGVVSHGEALAHARHKLDSSFNDLREKADCQTPDLSGDGKTPLFFVDADDNGKRRD